MNKKLFLIVFILMLIVGNSSIVAVPLDDLDANTSQSGWAYSTQSGHMGTKVSTYTYSSDAVRRTYANYVIGGIGRWTSYINMTYDPSSTQGLFKVSNEDNKGATASTAVKEVDVNGHRTKYEITIFSLYFDDKSTAGKNNTIAHEIGHAYGLGHVDTSSDIMYGTYSENKSVTNASIAGMKVVTHVHTHSSSSKGTYVSQTQQKHGLLCSDCKGIYYAAHTLPASYSYDASSHWKICSLCGLKVGNVAHNYINSGTYKQCRFCGYITYDVHINDVIDETE